MPIGKLTSTEALWCYITRSLVWLIYWLFGLINGLNVCLIFKNTLQSKDDYGTSRHHILMKTYRGILLLYCFIRLKTSFPRSPQKILPYINFPQMLMCKPVFGDGNGPIMIGLQYLRFIPQALRPGVSQKRLIIKQNQDSFRKNEGRRQPAVSAI